MNDWKSKNSKENVMKKEEKEEQTTEHTEIHIQKHKMPPHTKHTQRYIKHPHRHTRTHIKYRHT